MKARSAVVVRGTQFIELRSLTRSGVRDRCRKLGTGNLDSGKTNFCHAVSRCRLGGLGLVRWVGIWSIKLCDQTYKQDNCKPNQKAGNLVGHPSETTELQRAKSISLFHQYIIITAKYLLRAYASPARSISSLIVHTWSDSPLAIAGVLSFNVSCLQAKICHAKNRMAC